MSQRLKPTYTKEELSKAVELLSVLGINIEDEETADTPRRFVQYLKEYINPGVDLQKVLGTVFEAPNQDTMVVQTGIPFRAICAHHLLPFFGTAAIGYIPETRVVGLSKLSRLVEAVGTRAPSMQETITDIIANVLQNALRPLGTMVVIRAEHTCMAIRGVVAPGVHTITSSARGVYLEGERSIQARAEFFELAKLHG